MREDLVLTVTARGLRAAGLPWRPHIGDWCVVMDGVHRAESDAGLWLVIEADPVIGWAGVRDARGVWPTARISVADALWLPTAGQLKAWIHARGYLVATFDYHPAFPNSPSDGLIPANRPSSTNRMPADPQQPAPHSSPTARRGWAADILSETPQGGAVSQETRLAQFQSGVRCAITLPGQFDTIETVGVTEAEAIADAVLRILRQMPQIGY